MLKDTNQYGNLPPNAYPKNGGICMNGSIYFEKDRNAWAFKFAWEGNIKILRRYKGQALKKTHHNPNKDTGYQNALKLRAEVQSDYERYLEGLAPFNIEKYDRGVRSDVCEFYRQWLKDIEGMTQEEGVTPATMKGYKSYFNCHFEPFFEEYPMMLHQIELATLNKLKNYLVKVKVGRIVKGKCPKCGALADEDKRVCTKCDFKEVPLAPKMKFNIMNAFHAFLAYAKASKKILEVPSFPKKKHYGLRERDFDWYTLEEQMSVIDAIPEDRRDIFLWLKLHYRRIGEACNLRKIDYDEVNNAFHVRRSISAREEIDRTKTGQQHYIPCDEDFTAIAKRLIDENPDSPFMFVNPIARKDGKRYTQESIKTNWRNACEKVGIRYITPYTGLKHSSCTQFVNDCEATDDELMMLTDHANKESVRPYRKVLLDRKRKMQQKAKRKVQKQEGRRYGKLRVVK